VQDNPPNTFVLEKPIDIYSSKEIERIVLACESTKTAWRTDDGVPSRQREQNIDGAVTCAHLIPGGRWLISVFSDGRTAYYDLASTDGLREKKLIPAQLPPSTFNIFKISVDVTDTLPMTSFNLAMYVRERLDYHKTYNGLKFWKVELVFEGQDVIGLKATYLTSLLMDPEATSLLCSISLLGRHVAFSTKGSGRTPNDTFVVEWPDVTDASLDFPRTLVDLIGGPVRISHVPTFILLLTDIVDRNASVTEAKNHISIPRHCILK